MGGNKPEPPNLEDIAGVSDKKPPPPSSSSSGEAYKFDSSALERAAQAAKELEKSSRYLPPICYNYSFGNRVIIFVMIKFFKNMPKKHLI